MNLFFNALDKALEAAGTEPQPAGEARPLVLDRYDAGLLSDYGGGNVEWWQDYIRAELERAHDFYQSQADGVTACETCGGARTVVTWGGGEQKPCPKCAAGVKTPLEGHR